MDGLRGIITAIILDRLNKTPEIAGFINQTYLLAGTSTGAILASGLAIGKPLDVIIDLYKTHGSSIFKTDFLDSVTSVDNLIRPKYSNRNLKNIFERMFTNTMLGDLNKKILIPTFQLDSHDPDINNRSWKPKIFNNFKGNCGDLNTFVKDVLSYATAAPTYFPSEGYIDGGVFANNPSYLALMQIISTKNIAEECFKLEDIVLLDVGTGINKTFIEGVDINYGILQWMSLLINLQMDSSTNIVKYCCEQLLGDNYCQLEPVLNHNKILAMDDVKSINDMINVANTYDLTEYIQWIKTYWL